MITFDELALEIVKKGNCNDVNCNDCPGHVDEQYCDPRRMGFDLKKGDVDYIYELVWAKDYMEIQKKLKFLESL